jgi:transketolase
MRQAFVTALAELADSDPRVLLLTGDLGFMAVEPFADRHPDRFINVGVAEQNMVGMATGLAEAGYVPFVYSIATFAALRSYEFIRNGPVLHDLPVRVVGVGPGLDYGPNGITHWALEDVAVLRPLPGLAVIAPADDPQTASAVAATSTLAGPAYLRLARMGPAIAGLDGRFALGRAHVLGDGADIALVALGNMAATAVETQRLLAESGVAARVVVVSCVRPAPTHDLVAALSGVPLAISVESHYVDGGLGSLTAEVVAENFLATRLVRAGVRRSPAGETGGSEFLHDLHGLSARALVHAALEHLARKPRPLRRSA